MPLVKPDLEQAILDALTLGSDAAQDTDNPVDAEQIRADQAAALATAIDDYIKSATITVPAGIPVATAGSAAAQTGATTGPSGPATIS